MRAFKLMCVSTEVADFFFSLAIYYLTKDITVKERKEILKKILFEEGPSAR